MINWHDTEVEYKVRVSSQSLFPHKAMLSVIRDADGVQLGYDTNGETIIIQLNGIHKPDATGKINCRSFVKKMEKMFGYELYGTYEAEYDEENLRFIVKVDENR